MSCFITETEAAKANVTPIDVCRPQDWSALRNTLSEAQQNFANARSFDGGKGQRLRLPDKDGHIDRLLCGAGEASGDVLGAIALGGLASFLSSKSSETVYELRTLPADWSRRQAAIGWGLGAYKFARYLPEPHNPPVLMLSDDMNPDEVTAIVKGTWLGRDLINTPAGDMGPDALHAAATDLAAKYDAEIRETVGSDR